MDISEQVNWLHDEGWFPLFRLGFKCQYSRTWGDFKTVQADCNGYLMLVCWGRKLIWLTDVTILEHKSGQNYLEERIVEVLHEL